MVIFTVIRLGLTQAKRSEPVGAFLHFRAPKEANKPFVMITIQICINTKDFKPFGMI